MIAATESELRLWLDKLAIRDVLERYMRYNDDLAADRIAELFDEDARFQVMGQVHAGRDAIRAMFNRDGANRATIEGPTAILPSTARAPAATARPEGRGSAPPA